MARKRDEPRRSRAIWRLAERQHGVVSRAQLLGLGFSRNALEHRVRAGKLHRIRRGIYAVGRPRVDRRGMWMAAVLACGPGAALSHASAAALWGIRPPGPGIHVTVPGRRRASGLVIHERRLATHETRRRDGIPITSPSLTLVDLAVTLRERQLQAAVNRADNLHLIDTDRLAAELAGMPRRPGLAALRALLEPATFRISDTDLEIRFLALLRKAKLPLPLTQQWVNGFRVDFFWPDLGLVVETDGLTYHRTPLQQAEDIRRDRAHTAAGLTPMRFTRHEVRFSPHDVAAELATVLDRLARATTGSAGSLSPAY